MRTSSSRDCCTTSSKTPTRRFDEVEAGFGPAVREIVRPLLGDQDRRRGPQAALDRPQARSPGNDGRRGHRGPGGHPRRQAPQPHQHRARPGRRPAGLGAVQRRSVPGSLVLPGRHRRLHFGAIRGSTRWPLPAAMCSTGSRPADYNVRRNPFDRTRLVTIDRRALGSCGEVSPQPHDCMRRHYIPPLNPLPSFCRLVLFSGLPPLSSARSRFLRFRAAFFSTRWTGRPRWGPGLPQLLATPSRWAGSQIVARARPPERCRATGRARSRRSGGNRWTIGDRRRPGRRAGASSR